MRGRMTSNVAVCGVLLACGLVACGDDDAAPVDAGRRVDASIRLDASSGDAGSADGGSQDAGSRDASVACAASCDPVRGTGCAVGACVLTGDAPSCAPLGGSLTAGMPCEEPNQCAAGLACFRKRAGGVCAPICCEAADTCAEETRCGGTGILVDGTPTEFRECLAPRPCDVLDATTCEMGEACYIVSSTGDTDCRRTGEASVGEACADQSECAAGLFCGGLFEGECVRICELGMPCPGDEGTCRAYAQSPEGTGLCTP